MATTPRLDDTAREAALESLLSKYPEAPVAAVNDTGVYVSMPSSVPLRGQKFIEARSSMHFVAPADQLTVVDAFHRATVRGLSSAAVHLAKDPERTVILHYVDVRERHGVFVIVLAGYTGQDDVHAAVDAREFVPRSCRTRKNALSVFMEVDDATTRIFGWSRDQMVGRRSLDFIHPDDQGGSISAWMDMAALPGATSRARMRHLCRDGSWRWVETTNQNLMNDPQQACVIADMADISDEMAALEALRAREQLLDRLAEAIPLGLFQVDTNRQIVYTNDRLHQIVGQPPRPTVDEQMASIIPEDRQSLHRALDAVLDDGRDSDVDVRLQPPDIGPRRLCTMSLRALTSEAGQVNGAIVCVSDVTESARMRNELERRASLDPLTKCHNRRSIMTTLERTLAKYRETSLGVAAIFVDLDRFKPVNDRFGHAAGDELLTVVADRLRTTVRADDIVGRIGGDEFLVVCPRVNAAEETMILGDRISEALRRDITIASGTFGLRASIGVAWTNGIDVDADTLVGEADAAMYESKRQSAGQPVLFQPSLRMDTSDMSSPTAFPAVGG